MEEYRTPKYTADNLDLLHDGFTRLFHGLSHLIRKNSSVNASDIVKSLTVQDKAVWENLKEIFDEDSLFSVYEQESGDPVQVLAAIFNSMDEMREEVLEQAKVWEGKEETILAQLNDAKDQLETKTLELHNLEYKYRITEAEVNTRDETIKLLEKQIKEKDELIGRLNRGDNVTLWEKEKDRAFQEHMEKQKQLEDEINKNKLEFAAKAAKYERQITELQNNLHTTKISSEKNIGTKGVTVNGEYVSELKQQVFYLAKDLLQAEKELARIQKEITGVMIGVERDFRIVHQNMVDNKKFNILHMDKLANWLAKLVAAFQEGDMATVQKEMPDYYICPVPVAKKIKPIKVRDKSVAKTKTKRKSTTNLEGIVKGLEKDVSDIEVQQLMNENHGKPITNGAGGNTTNNHPELIHGNGTVNTTALIKHFPELSVGFVKEQFGNFKRYDKNGDGTLDLAEMMIAITTTFGHKFTAQEVVDVMTEVDDDQSSTLDFYEYLKVSVIILKKNGKSSLFKDEEVVKNKKELSKTCLVQ